jgi:site-specific DNA-cytosine methylase
MMARVMFCGVGGSTEGMVRAGLDVRDAIDSWPVAIERHRLWHPSITAVEGRCEDACELLPGTVDFVWASPSCRPWSDANRTPRRGKAHPEYYSLALLVAQAFDRWRARWLVIENVGGLVWSREGKSELAELASAVRAREGLTWTLTVVRSCEHGVRQLRRRPIIVVGPALCPILSGTEGAFESVRAITANRGGTNGSDPSRLRRTTIRSTRGGGSDSDVYAKRSVMASRVSSHMHDPRTGEVNHHEGRTLRECADLQQIPTRLLEGLTKTAAHRLVGNAVPPSLAEWVCRCVVAVDSREAEARTA